MVLEIIKTWYERNERKISVLAIFLGFITDSLTLRGSDQLIENLVLVSYLILTGLGIVILQKIERNLPVEAERGRIHFWTTFITQFALGGLYSAFFVFYFRSSSLEVSFPFLFIILFGLIANELFKKKSSNILFQISIFFFALFSFSLFLVPTVFKNISIWTFFGSSILTLVLFWLFLFILSKTIRQKYLENKKKIVVSVSSIFIFFHIFYFLNIIPPLPLVMKDVGIYHNIFKTDTGSYIVTKEKRSWFDKISIRETLHIKNGAPLFVWSAVYSPISLDTNIVHSWKKFDTVKNRWVSMGDIKIKIVGGRKSGYRMYSIYPNPTNGIWRVDVKTETGQIMGRIKFNVKEGEGPELVEEIK